MAGRRQRRRLPKPGRDALRTPLRARILARADSLRDALTPEQVRARVQAAQRKIGLTRSGAIALVVFFALWIFARIIGGLPIFMIAYGSLFLLVLSYLLSPKRLNMTGERVGLFPRAQQGDRMEVEVRLTATRSVST